MTEQQKQNMKTHIKFLVEHADDIRKHFNMRQWLHGGNECGSPSCALGWTVVSLDFKLTRYQYIKADFPFNKCNSELFGLDDNEFTYCFSGEWANVDNSPEAAAARLQAVLDNKVPKRWEFSKEFANPCKYRHPHYTGQYSTSIF